jgi:dihydroxy-acid dehydratase
VHHAEAAGRKIVELVDRDLRPSEILTREAFENAIRVLHAISGSTNAVVHLTAYAGRLGIDLPLDLFDELGRSTPWILDVMPAGESLMEAFYYAGGLPTVMNELRDLLHCDAITVSGETIGENVAGAERIDSPVIRTREAPLGERGSLAILHGSLCPDGAVIKISAADPRLLSHQGRAVVFDDLDDMAARVHDPDLDIDADSVMVLRNGGPVGGPGMPEWGHLPIPTKLLKAGVTDLVRISDARMSGTSFGTVVLHVAPEAAVGGPLGLVRDGDQIRLDIEARRLDLLVEEDELARRGDDSPPKAAAERGYTRLYVDHVLQANEGCDFDFLRGGSGVITDARHWM